MGRWKALGISGLMFVALSSCSANPAAQNQKAQVFTVEDADSIQLITAGQNFEVKLLGTPTAGYVWEVLSLPPGVVLMGSTTEPENPDGRAQGMTGGQDWTRLRFSTIPPSTKLSGTGGQGLVLRYGRPWELAAGKPPEKTWRILIEVRPAS